MTQLEFRYKETFAGCSIEVTSGATSWDTVVFSGEWSAEIDLSEPERASLAISA